MNQPTSPRTSQRPATPRYDRATVAAPSRALVPLLALFVLSGVAALIYEIVWFQLLELVIGSSAISLGVLLATYMGGMCLGSLLLPRVTRARAIGPLRLYAYLELGMILPTVVYAAGVLSAKGRAAVRAEVTWSAAAAGVGTFAAYALVLAALQRASLAPVAALAKARGHHARYDCYRCPAPLLAS